MPTEKEISRIELAMIYELRLIIDASDKDQYTVEELKTLLDQIALAKKDK